MHNLLYASLPLRSLQCDDEVGSRQEADLPTLVRGNQAKCDGEVGLTGTRWPKEDDVLGTLDEAERSKLLYLRARGAGGEREVVRLERLLRREPAVRVSISRARTRRASRSARRTSCKKSA
jgi:hypothetical protein